ncbi:MAG TPA: hypothetical protein VF515_07245 [Candidatus Binatia bacterium]
MERWRTAQVPAGNIGTPLKPDLGTQRGTSLVELLTSMVCVSLLMAMSYGFACNAFLSARVQEGKSDAQEVTLMAIDLLTREVRMAGFSAAGKPVIGVRVAAAEYVEVASDFDGDGDSDEANELIAYSYNDNKHQLVRATGGASPQPLVPNVPPGGLRFSYFDASGAEIPVSAGTLPLEQRRRIRRVDVVLRTQSADADPAGALPSISTVSSSICLRNQ